MSFTKFFVESLGSAIALGLATHDDVLKHATPDVLARHLPRPLWAKLIEACLAAKKTDAKLVVETVGLPALCENLPAPLIWTCLSEIGARVLGASASTTASAPMSGPVQMKSTVPSSTATPVSGVPIVSIPAAASASADQPAPLPAAPVKGVVPLRAQTEPPLSKSTNNSVPIAVAKQASAPVIASSPAPSPTSTPSNTRTISAGASTRRSTMSPEHTPAPSLGPPSPPPKGSLTRAPSSFDVEVEEEQLIDWAQSEETSEARGPDRGPR